MNRLSHTTAPTARETQTLEQFAKNHARNLDLGAQPVALQRWAQEAKGLLEKLVKDITAGREALETQGDANTLGEFIGCFDAAIAEGLYEAIAETSDERLKDLLERRVMHAYYKAIGPTHPQASEPAPSTAGELPERDTSKPAEAQGLFRKFDVTRVDGSSAPGGKHHGCEYFVLDVDHDPHAKAALQAYAVACAQSHPQLSADLIARHGYALQAEPCPICGGSGERTYMEGRGPDTYDVTAGCDACDGSGTLHHAYEKAAYHRDDFAAQLQAMRMKQYVGAALPVGELTMEIAAALYEQAFGVKLTDTAQIGGVLRLCHLAAASSQPVREPLTEAPRKLIGWRTSDYLMETSDPKMAKNWEVHHDILPIFEGDPNSPLAAIKAPGGTEECIDNAAVDAFATAMKDKLRLAREKGRTGWQSCSELELSAMLHEHVEKGDPRDVANFCMFLHTKGHGITKKGGEPAEPEAPHV